MHRTVRILVIIMILLGMAAGSRVLAETAPPNIVAVFIVKLTALEKNLATKGGALTVHVIGDEAVAAELQALQGNAIGSSTLGSVTSGAALPGSPPDILYVGSSGMIAQAAQYCRTNQVLSYTGLADQLLEGIVLGIGVEGGKPKVLLNLTASSECGVEWNPGIMRIAQAMQ